MSTLGYSTKGASNIGATVNYDLYAKYTTDASGGNTSLIHCKVKNNSSTNAYNVKMGIYSDDAVNNIPESLLGSVEFSIPAGTDGTDVSASLVVSLSPSTAYWIALTPSDGNIGMYYDGTGGDAGYYNVGSYTLQDPMNNSATSAQTWQYSMWADYSAASGVALAGSVTAASTTSSFLPYIYHYLVDNTVAGVSSLQSLLPYVYHYLINNVVAAISSIPSLLPYIYHYLINNVVAAVSSTWANLEEIAVRYIAGAINAVSSLNSLLPYTYHYLINNIVAGVSSIPSLLPYIFHRLLPDTVEIISTVIGNITQWQWRTFTAAVNGVSSLWANLTRIVGAANRFRIYMKIHRGRF